MGQDGTFVTKLQRKNRMGRISFLTLTASLALAGLALAQQPKQNREQKVLEDHKKVEADGFWIYNDVAKGFAEAKKTGKPLVVILRCIPCVECVKLDDDLVNQDKRVRPLLENFVRVRIVSTNGLDLSLFQFDFDQSFAAFFLNADGSIYGRFGTRSHRTSWADDVSIEGLAKALQGALDLHGQYPKNKEVLAAKKGPPMEVASPEQYPFLKGKYEATIKFEAGVVQSCIHCHQVGDARKAFYRQKKEPLPDQVIFPFPHPKNQGLILDPKEKATVLRVEKGSPAESAGFQKDDAILTLAGQPLLSFADVQWVLNQAPGDGAVLKAEVQRGGKNVELTLNLPKGWRQREDISWRASSWGLRRMAMGGMSLEDVPAEDRQKAGLSEKGMALRPKFIGQYAPYNVAKQAGFLMGDIITSFDGKDDLPRETDVLAYGVTQRKSGDKVAVTVLRGGKKLTLMMPMQD
jgi:serine protease Do